MDSDQSFDRQLYSNYDSKNETQKVNHMMLIQNPDGKSSEPQVLSHQPSTNQLFSKASTGKNSSRKAMTLLNQNSSEQISCVNQGSSICIPGNPKSPTFLSQNYSEKEEFKLENPRTQLKEDFKQLMFNNTVGSNTHQSVLSGGHDQTSATAKSPPNSMSIRTMHLKKEISSLDQEII